MAGPHMTQDFGYVAGEAINKFHAVKLVGAGTEVANQCDTLGERAWGVAQEEISADDATRGRVVNVRVSGVSRGIAGGAIAAYALVTVNAAGRFVTAGAGNVVAGRAMQTAAADGDHVDIALAPYGLGPTA